MLNETMILIADDPTYMQMGQRFESGGNATLTQAAIVLAVIIAIVFAIWATLRLREKRDAEEVKSPIALFRSICRAHKLRYLDQHLLLKLAKTHELRHPAFVFVHRELFHEHQLASLNDRQRHRLAVLERRIYS